jgi:hypothetical protein
MRRWRRRRCCDRINLAVKVEAEVVMTELTPQGKVEAELVVTGLTRQGKVELDVVVTELQ